MRMRSAASKLFFFAIFFLVFGGIQNGVLGAGSEAYVTLLYGDEFLLGVRVLGKSIRDTGTKKDMVVLVSDGVSDYAKKLLQVIRLHFGQTLNLGFCLVCSCMYDLLSMSYLKSCMLHFIPMWKI